MHSTRLAAVALLGLGVAICIACNGKQQNGMECLKDDDCESSHCIAQLCADPSASKGAFDGGTVADTGGGTDAPAEAAAEASTESGPDDTGTTSDAGDAD